jgi:hypothetical protein
MLKNSVIDRNRVLNEPCARKPTFRFLRKLACLLVPKVVYHHPAEKHICLTCSKEFALKHVHFRCVKPKCSEKDKELSEFLGIERMGEGRVIKPSGPNG